MKTPMQCASLAGGTPLKLNVRFHMQASRILAFITLVIPAVLSAAFMMATCQGDWFDNPELATCSLLGASITPETVTFFYFMGPLTLIAATPLWAVVYVVRVLRRSK
jgi:hypothetical protein